MKIVVLDAYALNPGDLSWEALKKLGETRIYERSTVAETAGRIADALDRRRRHHGDRAGQGR